MKPSGFPLTLLEINWATAPAIATDVASTTLSVIRYSARNTMVEKKSLASLANTSFIVVLSWSVLRDCKGALPAVAQNSEGGSDEAIHWSFIARRSKRVGQILPAG